MIADGQKQKVLGPELAKRNCGTHQPLLLGEYLRRCHRCRRTKHSFGDSLQQNRPKRFVAISFMESHYYAQILICTSTCTEVKPHSICLSEVVIEIDIILSFPVYQTIYNLVI